MQGGGVYVNSGGVANFQDCNIHENTARYVCLHLRTFPELSSIAPLERYVCAHGWQYGGGLLIYGTATLTNSNVYANQAGNVSSPFELSMSFHPSPP